MDIVEISAEAGMLIALSNDEHRAYAQAYPFLAGPRSDLNEIILDRLPGALRLRPTTRPCLVERLTAVESALLPTIEARARALFAQIGADSAVVAEAFERIAWKCRDVPPDTKMILAVGCGGGMELVFLRAAAPESRITAVDWSNRLTASVTATTDVVFHEAPLQDYLEKEEAKYDLIFTNHVLEHMYDPDNMIALLARCLKPEGTLIAALPLDGQGGAAAQLYSRASGGIHPTELSWSDLGHPWKTTATDVSETFARAGFASARLIQRAAHLGVKIPGDQMALARVSRRGQLFRRLLIEPIRSCISVLFGPRPPRIALRLYFAIERQLWFGSNNLKNTITPEALCIAKFHK